MSVEPVQRVHKSRDPALDAGSRDDIQRGIDRDSDRRLAVVLDGGRYVYGRDDSQNVSRLRPASRGRASSQRTTAIRP